MDFIIGGAWQGKLDYARKQFSLNDSDIFQCSSDRDIDREKRCICNLEQYILYAIRNGISPDAAFREDAVIIANDIFCGVVPIDTEIRFWREETGRFLTRLAQRANTVTRVFCGIPLRLKQSRSLNL